MSEELISRKQLDLLPYRIQKALESDAVEFLRYYLTPSDSVLSILKNQEKPFRVMIVGTGGSYSAALAISHYVKKWLQTPNVEVYPPQTALRVMEKTYGQKYDIIIGLSYSGDTPDILAVYGLSALKNYPFLLITGAKKDTTLQKVQLYFAAIRYGCRGRWPHPKIVSYFNPDDESGKEKGYISMFSTLAPVVLFDKATGGNTDYASQIAKDTKENVLELLFDNWLADSLRKHPVIHVLYEWENFPAASYLESIFIESGIANVVLHEKKNFSHGRMSILCCQDFGLVINLVFSENSYEEKLDKIIRDLCEKKERNYLKIKSEAKGQDSSNFETMCRALGFAVSLSESLGVDISNPFRGKKHPHGEADLYDHDDDF